MCPDDFDSFFRLNRSAASLFRLVFLPTASGFLFWEKVLHQTLIEVHTATGEAWQQLHRHHLRDLETISYPHAVPFKDRARVFARRSWFRARRGAEHTETEISRFNYVRSGTGLQSKRQFPEYRHSDRTALDSAHCLIAGRKSCSLVSALVGLRAAPVPSNSTPLP